ncbi:hypothetical protein [Endozoicomonas sp. ALB032]|uniref:hypothetical protein n=1 Tax=Endozoicomonas sp. ALB032 TaxID=3403082 RepID=UPI003BB72480
MKQNISNKQKWITYGHLLQGLFPKNQLSNVQIKMDESFSLRDNGSFHYVGEWYGVPAKQNHRQRFFKRDFSNKYAHKLFDNMKNKRGGKDDLFGNFDDVKFGTFKNTNVKPNQYTAQLTDAWWWTDGKYIVVCYERGHHIRDEHDPIKIMKTVTRVHWDIHPIKW